jgi:hypothetical protein
VEDRNTDNVTQVAFNILAYLARHPEAKDGLEGIVEWWILEQHIVNQTAIVGAALETLVRRGWLVAEKRTGRGRIYGINPDKVPEIREIVRVFPLRIPNEASVL